jgi:hypothetical protein
MKKCVVVKLYGNMEDAPKIAEPFTKVIPVDDRQMQMVISENKRLNALNGVRCYGDSVRWQTVADALAVKYQPKHHGRLYGAILTAWACLWLAVYGMAEYLMEWNRRSA